LGESEERKETEQLPITKDLLMNKPGELDDIHHILNEDSDEMNGIDVEFSDNEKKVAQKSIRRSVVKDKLNWSCQFAKGTFGQLNDGVQKMFMDSKGANLAL
jgi:hypothetical protein